MAARLLALLGAIALIVGAFVVRGSSNGDGSSSGEAGSDLVLICASEAATVCETLDSRGWHTRVEVAGHTADRLTAASDAPSELWVVDAAWPSMVTAERARRSQPDLLGDPSDPLARSPLALVVWTDRAEALRSSCGALDWECLLETAGRDWPAVGGSAGWGRVAPGHGPADTTAGLVTLSALAGELLGTAEFASNDFVAPGFRSGLSAVERSVPDFTPSSGTPLEHMLVFGPASYSFATEVEAVAHAVVDGSRDAGRLEISIPDARASVEVVVVSTDGTRVSRSVIDALTSVLREQGWQEPDGSGNGRPAPGVAAALRSLWSELT